MAVNLFTSEHKGHVLDVDSNINNIKQNHSIFCVNENLFNVFALKLTKNTSHNLHHILAMAG